MSATTFLSYVNSQITAGGHSLRTRPDTGCRAVTISRQAGCGAQEIAERLAVRLQAHGPPNGCPWTVFDRDLMGQVLADHCLPQNLAACLPADRQPPMADILDDVFGRHPPQSTSIRQTAETLLGLAELGNVVLIGRGGNVVTAQLPHVLHVRLVAPLDARIEHAHRIYGMGPREARNFCLREDLGRERYVSKHFNADINDPLLYHLVINTSLESFEAAAMLIEDALMNLETMPKQGEHLAPRERELTHAKAAG